MAPAAAIKKYKNVNNIMFMIVDNIRQKKAPAAAVTLNKNSESMICHYFDNIQSEKGACGR